MNLFQNPTIQRILLNRPNQVLLDGAVAALTFWGAWLIRFDGEFPPPLQDRMIYALPAVVALYLLSNFAWGIYRQVWHFVGLRDAVRIGQSVLTALILALVMVLGSQYLLGLARVPLGIVLMHPFLLYPGWLGARLFRRFVYARLSRRRERLKKKDILPRTLLIGAGQAGVQLVNELSRSQQFEIVGFLDDNPQLRGRLIEGYPVLGSTYDLTAVVVDNQVDEVTLCLPTAPVSVLRRIVQECKNNSVKATTVPSWSEILTGKLTISRLRPVRMEDLLGRGSIHYPKDRELSENYRDRRILITGAGGSIGSELVRQLRHFDPSQLILLDKDENALYEIGLEIRETFPQTQEVVADIRDEEALERIFERFTPQVVFHAAAYKHVPLMESNPAEAVLNNIMGSRNVIELSHRFGVSRFVQISTDKAVNPSNIMGASKRVAEMLVQQRAAGNGCRTRFCCVRFGNVLGSRASVVPLFQKRIRDGKPLRITHPEMRRYFMTIPEAVQLVIQAGSLGRRGEIFVLDMGDPVKIHDLALNLIKLSGLVPEKDVRIEFTGPRPGEKLNEELLLSAEEGVRSTKYSKIFVVGALPASSWRLQEGVEKLYRAARRRDAREIRRVLRDLRIGYRLDPASGALGGEPDERSKWLTTKEHAFQH